MKRAQAIEGTGRSGGTVEANREAGATATSKIDDIINKTLQTNKQEGAQGLVQVGRSQLQNAIANLGLSSNAVNDILSSSITSRGQSFDIASSEGSALASLILAGIG